jgi:transposase
MTALSIRADRTPSILRKLAKAETNTRVARRLLAIANALSGMSRKEAAEAAGMDRQTLREGSSAITRTARTGFTIAGATGARPALRRTSRLS